MVKDNPDFNVGVQGEGVQETAILRMHIQFLKKFISWVMTMGLTQVRQMKNMMMIFPTMKTNMMTTNSRIMTMIMTTMITMMIMTMMTMTTEVINNGIARAGSHRAPEGEGHLREAAQVQEDHHQAVEEEEETILQVVGIPGVPAVIPVPVHQKEVLLQ